MVQAHWQQVPSITVTIALAGKAFSFRSRREISLHTEFLVGGLFFKHLNISLHSHSLAWVLAGREMCFSFLLLDEQGIFPARASFARSFPDFDL